MMNIEEKFIVSLMHLTGNACIPHRLIAILYRKSAYIPTSLKKQLAKFLLSSSYQKNAMIFNYITGVFIERGAISGIYFILKKIVKKTFNSKNK